MYFCNVFPNLNTSWKLKKLFIYFLDGSDIHTAPKYGLIIPPPPPPFPKKITFNNFSFDFNNFNILKEQIEVY